MKDIKLSVFAGGHPSDYCSWTACNVIQVFPRGVIQGLVENPIKLKKQAHKKKTRKEARGIVASCGGSLFSFDD